MTIFVVSKRFAGVKQYVDGGIFQHKGSLNVPRVFLDAVTRQPFDGVKQNTQYLFKLGYNIVQRLGVTRHTQHADSHKNRHWQKNMQQLMQKSCSK